MRGGPDSIRDEGIIREALVEGSPVQEVGEPQGFEPEGFEADSGDPDDAEPSESQEQSLPLIEVADLELPALLEALLFVAPGPTTLTRLAHVLEVGEEAVEVALAELAGRYGRDSGGLRVVRKADRVQLTTAPEAASFIEKFLGLDLSTKLSGAALETLAVVAYRQPLTRGDIEAIRGVNCDGVLKTLLTRALIEPVGRLEQPGRPFLYGTTLQFLQYFGLEGLDRLPPLPTPESGDAPKV